MNVRLSLLCLVLPGLCFAGEGSGPNAIKGFTQKNGVYVPAEPYTDGMPRATGLQQAWPKMKSLDKNPITPDKVELGRLLFFDPIVSGDNTASCATCHNPDFGFSDGRKTSMGTGGKGMGAGRTGGTELKRNAPTIWNAAYAPLQFWDGRAEDLEAQAMGPTTNPDEMNENPEKLISELKAIPEYVELFKKAFGGDEPVTFENFAKAVASFERTIVSYNSKFDRYAAGDTGAMSDQERRGMQLFRSLKTRCFECHTFPNFTDGSFRVLGVPEADGSYDRGRGNVPGQGPVGGFKVPTLRNVALNAPYMHNGAHATLEETIDFYSKGGAHQFAKPADNIDDKIGVFEITPEEKSDLVAFMNALTDTSLQPEAPTKVPSGLPVIEVKSKAQPAPAMAATIAQAAPAGAADSAAAPSPVGRSFTVAQAAPGATTAASDSGSIEAQLAGYAAQMKPSPAMATFTVRPGQSIQAAVDRAQSGDRVEIYPGVYNQSIAVDRAGISIIGITVNGERPVLDGQNTIPDAVQASGDNFLIQGLTVKNYTGNGVLNNKSKNITYRDLWIENTGLYGIYPVECHGVLVEGCVVTQVKDAGIYVGQSRDIIVRNCEAFENVAGIEIENCVNALVTNNTAHNNTAGILVFLLPGGASKVSSHCRVVNNRIFGNNHENFAKKGSIVSFVPVGLGMLVMAADHVEITKNQIYGNDSQGITVSSFNKSRFSPKEGYELDIEPNCDNCYVYDNMFKGNGANPSATYKALGIGGGDIVWDGTGTGNGFKPAEGLVTFPKELPAQSGLQSIAGQ